MAVTARLADKGADYPAIIAGAYAFAAESGLNDVLPATGDPFEQAVARIIASPATEVLLAEHDGKVVGGLGLAYGPFLWNPSLVSADELFWWAAPGAPPITALALLRAGIARMVANGVNIGSLAALDTSPEGVSRVYEKLGFRLVQKTYMKVF